MVREYLSFLAWVCEQASILLEDAAELFDNDKG
jgi:hypothetical protein